MTVDLLGENEKAESDKGREAHEKASAVQEKTPTAGEGAAHAAPAAEAKSPVPAANATPLDPASQDIMNKIEEERKKKGSLLDEVRRYRRRLAYKLAEKEAVDKLVSENKKSTKNIGYLRRRKEALEFRISTEAFTLSAEKDLIRKKQEVEEELQEAISSYRIKRKAEFVAGDILELNKKIEEIGTQLQELEGRLDVLYNGLRRQRAPLRPRKQEHHQPQQQEVSFADIAVIKEKKKEEKESDE